MSFETFRLLIVVTYLITESFSLYGGIRAFTLARHIQDKGAREIILAFGWASLSSLGRAAFWLMLLFFDSVVDQSNERLVSIWFIVLSIVLIASSAATSVFRWRLYRQLTGE